MLQHDGVFVRVFVRARRRGWATLFTALASLALLLGVARTAWAHAHLLSASPKAGSTLHASPSRIRLVFSEALEGAMSRVLLVEAQGRETALVASSESGDPRVLVATLTPLSAGAYQVRWRVVSADGHPVQGTLAFTVAASAAPDSASGGDRGASQRAPVAPTIATPVPAPAPAPASSGGGFSTTGSSAPWSGSLAGAPALPALLRGLSDGALLASLGVLFFLVTSGIAESHGSSASADDRLAGSGAVALARALATLAAVLLVLHTAAWIVATSPDHRLSAGWMRDVLRSDVGRLEIARVLPALCALAVLRSVRGPSLALGFTLLAVLASGASGHAVAIHPLLAIPSKIVHLLGVAVWLGGLLWLVVMMREPAESTLREANRVSALALVAVILVALSGVVQALLFVPDVAALVHTTYGALVLAKVAGLVLLAAFGAYHRQRVMPILRAGERAPWFGSTLRAEIGVMCVVLLIGGALAYVSPTPDAPPSGPEAASPLDLPR